jgi:glutathione peroxidase-family protein
MTIQNTNNRLSPGVLNTDQDVFQGLQTIANYTPLRQEASIAQIEQAQTEMFRLQNVETQLKAQYRAALDAARKAEWNFHNTILEAKNAVVAQFGADSSEAQTVGRKKKSAYKRPVRQPKSA